MDADGNITSPKCPFSTEGNPIYYTFGADGFVNEAAHVHTE
jgi:hypothetical protein